jgi:hypothetical protein
MSRAMTVVDAPSVFPARCACGSVAGPLVDTMMETAAGRVYVCSRCAATIAGLLGWTSPDDTRALRSSVDGCLAKISELNEALAEERARPTQVVSVDELLAAAKADTAAKADATA